MRILEVIEASGSGTLEIAGAIASRAARDGHEVTLAYGERPETPPGLGLAPQAGLELVALPWADRRPATQVAAGRALRRLAAHGRPDVVHLHSSFAGLVGSVALPPGAPRVFTPHAWPSARGGGGISTRFYGAAERWIVRRSDIVGAVSHSEAALASQRGARRVVVVPNGIAELDPGRIPAPRERPEPVVVGAGRIGAQRRPASSARILAALAGEARVEWIGGAPAGEDAPLVAAGVPVTGWLPRAEGLDRLAEATALLHWSSWDGQPLAILEAFARDVVVIASDIPANRELVGERQVCRDEAQAIALLRRVLTEPALREAMLADQRVRREEHGAERMTLRWLELYGRLAAPAPVAHERDATLRRNIERSWS